MKLKVEPFSVGPLLGAASADSARVWGRGSEQRSGGSLRRLFGIARVRAAGGSFAKPVLFKLNPNFDLTGVAVFKGLSADSNHDYEAGQVISDLEFEDLEKHADFDWSASHRASFRTASTDPSAERSFVFGSCRYLLKLFGGSWFDDRGDKTFRSIREQIEAGRRTDFLLMIGDQIYADDLNLLLPDRTIEEFLQRYREVFSQPRFRELVCGTPTYMTLDDHEIEDNWPASASRVDLVRKFPAAIHALLCYQLSHGPLFDSGDDGRLTGRPERLWYRFADGCCEFFVTDTRTERFYGPQGERERIMSVPQMNALKEWLADGSGRVKAVVTAVPFFPDLGGDSDRWDAFSAQRNEILEHIRSAGVKRTLFLSGDVHRSLSAELTHRQDPAFKVISAVSSPFFWPYPHGHEKGFQLSGELSNAPGYVVRRGGPVHATDNFVRLTVNLEGVKYEAFGRKGEKLGSAKTHKF